MKRILVGRAADTYVLGSFEKLGAVCSYTVTTLSSIAGVITDTPADHPTVEQLRDQGVSVIQA
jgi:DeoR/GlpR family transcriptional regulator of sugar metabolism